MMNGVLFLVTLIEAGWFWVILVTQESATKENAKEHHLEHFREKAVQRTQR